MIISMVLKQPVTKKKKKLRKQKSAATLLNKQKPKASIFLKGETLEVFPLILGTR